MGVRIDLLASYQKCLLGGLGGLFGWGLISLFNPFSSTTPVQQLLGAMWTGALVGLAIGASLGAWNGLFRERSRYRFTKGISTGAMVGFVGGMVGLAAGELVFSLAGSGLFLRAIGWAVFGALVGASEGVAKKMPQKLMFGAYGGMLGGLIGGSTYQSLAEVFQAVGISRGLAIALGGSIGLVLLGMSVGLMVALVEDLLRAAWLRFTNGQHEGQTRTLDPQKKVITLGRDEHADICILRDAQIAAEHAQFMYEGGAFVIEAIDGPIQVDRGGKSGFRLSAGERRHLESGDLLHVGSTRALFQTGSDGR